MSETPYEPDRWYLITYTDGIGRVRRIVAYSPDGITFEQNPYWRWSSGEDSPSTRYVDGELAP